MSKETSNDNSVENIKFQDALGDRYLAYALSTIMSRSLPDIRDGLKPVHRRLLYAMLQLKLNPEAAYKKCARVVGDVIGKYHPHGEMAVYDTLVRLAQDFSLRYPLIEGQGNFGSIDGDNAAAMRYTESKLTVIATELMKDMELDTVDFSATYDNSDSEPVLFPSRFPNLLANGSEGIAVGMATNIPPHNLDELCGALIHLVDNKNTEISELLEHIKGPDFPTGGTIIAAQDELHKIYTTGRGSFKLRAKWEREDLSHGTYQIVISEIPYQVQKSRLLEKFAGLLREKKLPLIGNIRDESADDIRVIIEPKNRNCQAEALMESVFKLTDLEIRFSANMNMLDSKSVPRVMNLKEILREFLNHRFEIVTRRSKFLLDKIARRMEILQGLRIAYLNLDEVIRIIREEDEPKQVMMKAFSLSDIQVEAILNMRLRSLRKLEEQLILKEYAELEKEQEALQAILSSERRCWSVVKKELKEIQDKYGVNYEFGARRTSFAEAAEAQVIDIEAFIEREPITISCSKMGWMRAVKGHADDGSNAKYKDGDEARFLLRVHTTDKLLIMSKQGRFYTLSANNIPKGKGHGDPVQLMVDFNDKDDVALIMKYEPNQKLLLAANNGKGFIVNSSDVIAQTKSGKQVINPAKGYEATICKIVEGDSVAIIGQNRKLLIFVLSEIPEMKKGQGVILQRYTQAKLADLKTFKREDGLQWKLGERTRTEENLVAWFGKRGAVGKIPPTGFPRSNKFEE